MNNYITGKIIKELREKQQLTQLELANIIGVSDKTISKWETGKGLPDISLIVINCKVIENEYYISIKHDMTKEHYISFIAYITNDRCEIVKLYPEQNAEARFMKRGRGIIYAYCNKDGLIKKNM